jgi:hypothetical protein
MRSRIALLTLVAGLGAGLFATMGPSKAQQQGGGGGQGNTNGPIFTRVLYATYCQPTQVQVSPHSNNWIPNEVQGTIKNWAEWRWMDEDGNWAWDLEPELENVTYDSVWITEESKYEVYLDENLLPGVLLVQQDWVREGVRDDYIDVEARYMGLSSYSAIWVLE